MALTKRTNVKRPEVIKNRHKITQTNFPRIIINGVGVGETYSSHYPTTVLILQGSKFNQITEVYIEKDGVDITPALVLSDLVDKFIDGVDYFEEGEYLVRVKWGTGEIQREFKIVGLFIIGYSEIDGGDVLG